MAKLQKQKSYVYTSKKGEKITHYKHTLNMPEHIVRKLGWRDGEEITVSRVANFIVLTSEEAKVPLPTRCGFCGKDFPSREKAVEHIVETHLDKIEEEKA